MMASFLFLALGAVVFLVFAALGALADWIDGINK